MSYIPITSFRRAVDAVQVEQHQLAQAQYSGEGIRKWDILNAIGACREALGLSDRTISVLQALISFFPKEMLGEDPADSLVVFPSNAAICQRLNGMASSTMRRHLAALVACGLVLRRDSPNGKRFVRRDGPVTEAYGFDLAPLLHRFAEFQNMAAEAHAAAARYARLRRAVSLMRRDLAGLVAYGQDNVPEHAWDALSDLAILSARALRRKLAFAELEALEVELAEALKVAQGYLYVDMSDHMSTKDAHTEQHIQSSKTDSNIDKNCQEKQKKSPIIPLFVALKACREIELYSDCEIQTWPEFANAAEKVRPMMGISENTWNEAVTTMGRSDAALVLACMLERLSDIRSPGAYLRSLTQRAADQKFSTGPMLLALFNREFAA